MDSWILTILTFFPMLGILILLLVNRERHGSIRTVAFVTSLLNAVFSLYVYFNFAADSASMQFSVSKGWIES